MNLSGPFEFIARVAIDDGDGKTNHACFVGQAECAAERQKVKCIVKGKEWDEMYREFCKLLDGPLASRYKHHKTETMRKLLTIYKTGLAPGSLAKLNKDLETQSLASVMGRHSTAYEELCYVYELKEVDKRRRVDDPKDDPKIEEWARASKAGQPLPEGRKHRLLTKEIKSLYVALQEDNKRGEPYARGPQFLHVLHTLEHC